MNTAVPPQKDFEPGSGISGGCAILVAGIPAAGKTRFACWLGSAWQLPCLSKDGVKELLFDQLGFESRRQKVALGAAAQAVLLDFAARQLEAQNSFILENNFEDSSIQPLTQLLDRYGCRAVTVRFGGDIEVLYHRFIARDKSPQRHRGHVVNAVYPEVGPPPPYVPMGLAAFTAGVQTRGFDRFAVRGPVIPVDCTDFAQVDYKEIARKINTCGSWL